MVKGNKLALVILLVVALVAPITFGLTAWLWQGNNSHGSTGTVDAALRAIPVRAMNASAISAFDLDLDFNYDEPVIRDYFVDYTTNRTHFLIDVGYIKDAFVGLVGMVNYRGAAATISVSEVNKTTITNSMTRAVSNSVTVSESHTFTASVQAGPSVFRTTATWAGNVAQANAIVDSSTRGFTEVESFATTITTTYAVSGKEHGWYRLAIYDVVDMFFVVETSADNQTLYNWEMVAFPRGEVFYSFEFCPGYQGRRPIFDNTPLSDTPLINFAHDFYRHLPIIERTQEPTPNTQNGTFLFVGPPLGLHTTIHIAGQVTVYDGSIVDSVLVSSANLQWGNQVTTLIAGTMRLVSYTTTNTIRVLRNNSGGTEVVRVQIGFIFMGNRLVMGGIELLRTNNSVFRDGSLTFTRLSY